MTTKKRKPVLECVLRLETVDGQEIGAWNVDVHGKNRAYTTSKKLKLQFVPHGSVFKNAIEEWLKENQNDFR